MGLISWIKGKYYNCLLSKADSARESQRFIEAETAYNKILRKHPDAAEHLAKMYYNQATSDNDKLLYINKLEELHKEVTEDKKVSEHLSNLISHIERVAEKDFDKKDYENALKYLKLIESHKTKDTDFAKKKRLCGLYIDLKTIEDKPSYTSAIDTIDTYCDTYYNIDKEEIEEAISNTSKRLRKSKQFDRAYCVSNCLAKKDNKNAIKECVDTALQIYRIGKPSDTKVIDKNTLLDYISSYYTTDFLERLEPFARFAEEYNKKYVSTGISVISAESDRNKAFDTFKTVWKNTPDESLIKAFAKQSSNIATLIFDYFVDNIEKLTTESTFAKTLFQELVQFENYSYVLDTLEKFKSKKLDTKKAYISKAKSTFNSLEDKLRLELVNRVILNYPDDPWAKNEKMSFGKKHQQKKEYAEAIQLYKELSGLHADSEPKLAQLYFEQYQSESDFVKKRDLLQKAYSFKERHNKLFNTEEYNKLIPQLSTSVIELIKDRFANKDPEEAYDTAVLFKDCVSDCFTKYIKELKEYSKEDSDVTYILSKLEILKNKGIDTESDYKDIVNRVTSTTKYEDQYKLEILSKAINLFPDKQIREYFIQTAINVIKQENECTKAVSVFRKTWEQLADSKLLDAFVNQEYCNHTSIVDYLVDKVSISQWEGKLLSTFCDQLSVFDDYKYSLSVFDRLAAKGIDVQKSYIDSVLKALPSLNDNEKLSLVNETLAKYSHKYLIDEKFKLSETFAAKGNYDITEKILKELIDKHKMAEPKLANLYYEKSKREKNLETKLQNIKKGLSFQFSHSLLFDFDEYRAIYQKLLSEFKSLIDKYYTNNQYREAYQLCIELKKYSDKWHIEYINLRTKAVSKIETDKDKITFIQETFNTLKVEGYSLSENNIPEINTLWDILFKAQLSNAKACPYKKCVLLLQNYSKYILKFCHGEKANALLKKINSELASLHKSQGYKSEQEGLYSDAISSYTNLSTISDNREKSWCEIRCLICNIKDSKNVSEDEVKKRLSYVGWAKEKKDLAYRYSLYLIKTRGAKESLSFISEFLPDEEELISICKNEYIKEAESLLNKLNQNIDRINHGLASLSEARELVEHLNDYDEQISPYLKGVHTKILALRPSLQSYILSKCYEEGDYEQALKYLKNTGNNWYEDNIYFRNVAIACLGIAETGKINKVNYKAIISCWLTAVYQDQLFISSLDYTSWDDSYTFTLKNSLGGSKDDSFDSLPDNINFEEQIEGSVISIAEVQQNLLNRFETALNDKDDIFRDFYDAQKDAMDKLIKLNLNVPCTITAPYLANNTPKCLNEIKETLNDKYNNYGNEVILKVGILYGMNSGTFKDYKDATNKTEACITTAKSLDLANVKSSFTNTSISSIQKFPELYSSFTTKIQDILRSIICGTTSYKSVLNIFSIICRALKDSYLSYIFGKYISKSVIDKLDNNSLDLASGLKDLVSAYSVAKNYSKLKSDIGDVLAGLVIKYIKEANSSDLSTIKSVLNSTDSEFESYVANTLSGQSEQVVLYAVTTGHPETIDNLTSIPAKTFDLLSKLNSLKEKKKEILLKIELNKIINSVNTKTMSCSLALSKVYSLYKDNKKNSYVCDNLCTLINICIHQYVIPDASEKSTIMSIFNELKFNKSTTYRKSAQTLKDARQKILNKCQPGVRTLLTEGTGSTLSEEGKKLKDALQLYLDLA